METIQHWPWYTKRKRVPLALRDARMVPKQVGEHGTMAAAFDVASSPQPAVGPLAAMTENCGHPPSRARKRAPMG